MEVNPMSTPKYTPEQRIAAFWAKADQSGGADACWIWQGGTKSGGYGIFWNGNRLEGAHQFSYRLSNGSIPEGLFVCHQCDNPACVNPKHLFLGTNQDNVDDCVAKGRHAYGEKQPTHKLTLGDVHEIRQLWSLGEMTQLELATQFGVSRSNISFVVGRKTWKS